MGFPGLFMLGFRQQTGNNQETTLRASASGASVLICDCVSSGDLTTMEGNEVGSLLVLPSRIGC